MKHRAAIVAVALLLGACVAPSESGGTPPAPASTAGARAPDQPASIPAVSDPTTSIDSAGAGVTDPDDRPDDQPTGPEATEPTDEPASDTTAAAAATGSTESPSTVSPRVAAAVPTTGVTVVHVGWDLSSVWTPLAIWDGAAWQSADDAGAVPDSTFGSVSVVGLRQHATGLAYSDATDDVCIDDRRGPLLAVDGPDVELPGGDGYRAVGVAADWDVQPRPVIRSGVDSFQYQQIGESIVTAAGVDPSGGDVVEVVRVDLDGDGMQEVFVTFEKITDGGGAPGDFVVIFGRYPKPTGTVTDSVLFEYYPEAWTSHPTIGRAELLAIGDFNGDTVMEVVLSSRFWDSTLAELLVFDGGTSLRPIGGTGCSL